MKAELCRSMEKQALSLLDMYNTPNDRAPESQRDVTFEIERVVPLSETTGVVVFKKSNKQRTAVWLYHMTLREGPTWRWLTASYDQVLGMRGFIDWLQKVEALNYKANTE